MFLGLAALAVADVAGAGALRPALDGVVGAAVLVGVASWIRSNRAALDQQDWCECAADTLTVRVIASRRLEPGRSISPRVAEPLPLEEDQELSPAGVADS